MNLIAMLKSPKTNLELFIRTVEISTYIPGRIRLYSKSLKNNAALKVQIQQTLQQFSEIDSVEINTITGSILLQYSPQLLRTNAKLVKVENYIKAHVSRRL